MDISIKIEPKTKAKNKKAGKLFIPLKYICSINRALTSFVYVLGVSI